VTLLSDFTILAYLILSYHVLVNSRLTSIVHSSYAVLCTTDLPTAGTDFYFMRILHLTSPSLLPQCTTLMHYLILTAYVSSPLFLSSLICLSIPVWRYTTLHCTTPPNPQESTQKISIMAGLATFSFKKVT
jgi:hypothetical protein